MKIDIIVIETGSPFTDLVNVDTNKRFLYSHIANEKIKFIK
jgi:hypothetical protein